MLQVPNEEAQVSLADQLINAYLPLPVAAKFPIQDRLYDALIAGDLATLERHIKALFAAIPWRNFTNNDLPETEGYYACVLYAFFASLNATIIPEDISSHGQADLTVMPGDYIYVMEIKRDDAIEYRAQSPNSSLEQIRDRGYADKYRASGKTVVELVLIFNSHARNLVQMDWQ